MSRIIIGMIGTGLATPEDMDLAELTSQFFKSLAEDKVFLAGSVDKAIALTKEILQDSK